MKRYVGIYIALGFAICALIFWNINSGSVELSLSEVWNIMVYRKGDETVMRIVWSIRLPRIMAALILGGALSVAGYLLQTYFSNPIAGPYILGVASSAKLTVALALIYTLNRGISITSGGMVAAAFIGSLIAMGFVLLISSRVRNMSMLIVCGVMIGYICSAITDFVITFANDANIVNLHNWSQGSFSGTTWENVRSMSILVLVVVLLTFCLSKPIGALSMGEGYAKSVGVNIIAVRISIILLSSLLSACVTAFAGPISFVGIAVPHLVKLMLKTSKPIVMIPGCFLGGAAIMLLCDGIARVCFAPTELAISSVTAILLVPVVLYMILRRNRQQ